MKNLLIAFVLGITLLCATVLTLAELSLLRDVNDALKVAGELIDSRLD